MKNLIALFLFLALVGTACAPGASAPQAAAPTQPATPTQTPAIPISASLLLIRYDAGQRLNVLTAVDPATGHELAGVLPVPVGQNYVYALASDRKTLAVILYPSPDSARGAKLRLVDLEDWSLRDLELGLDDWVLSMAYAPDGSSLAITSGPTDNRLMTVDTTKAVILNQTKLGFYVRKMKFNADATALMLYGASFDRNSGAASGSPVAALLGSSDLGTLWSASLSDVRDGLYPKKDAVNADLHAPGQSLTFSPGLAFAPDADMLYVADAEKDQLVSVDFTARSVQARAVHAELGWLEQLLAWTAGSARAKGMDGDEKSVIISPDGRFLYITSIRNKSVADKNGEWTLTRTRLGLQVICAADAAETGRFDTQADQPLVSADGQFVYLQTWDDAERGPATQIFDARQGRIIANMPGFLLTPTRLLNGQPILVSSYKPDGRTQLAVFAPGGSDPLAKWPVDDYAEWVIIP